jgi:hypothetical protein
MNQQQPECNLKLYRLNFATWADQFRNLRKSRPPSRLCHMARSLVDSLDASSVPRYNFAMCYIWLRRLTPTCQDEQEEQEVFSQLCAMLRNMYFQREHQLLASYTPDKEALWKTVRKIEDDFAAKAQEIKDEALIAFGKSDWSSNQPHLTNPRQRGLDHSRFRARNQDQEEIATWLAA